MVVKVDVAVNHLIDFEKGSGLGPVNALCFEDGKEILRHSIVITVFTS